VKLRYGVAMPLRVPAVLAFTVVGGAAVLGAVAAAGCGNGTPPADAIACSVICVPQGSGSNACTPAVCATGANHDVCPAGCVPEPIV
jgi:hypothetical protein